jgi:ABC-type dipeptide/oligopeptide/nickel transport system permease subunit
VTGSGPWLDAWARLRRDPGALAGAALLAAVAAACALGPLLLALDPATTTPASRHLPPSAAHWFGTDALGRDLFARVLVGGRTSLLVGVAATGVSVAIGTLYGAASGYYGGRVDELLMRFVDFLYGVPYMFLVILVMLLFSDTARGEPLPVFLALGLVQWLTMARIVRGQVRSLKQQTFVEAARALGAGAPRIVFAHLVPNALGPVIVTADQMPEPYKLEMTCTIERAGAVVFSGSVSTAGLQRRLDVLIEYLLRSNPVPAGSVLLTGTGIVIPEGVSLAPDDVVNIRIPEIGELSNRVTPV